jgi:hypothetical protein
MSIAAVDLDIAAPLDVEAMSPNQAAAKLDELLKDSDWQQRYLSGSERARREHDELATKAEADDRLDKIVDGSAESPLIETVGPGQITDRAAMNFAADLREIGVPDDAIKQALRGQPVSKAEYDTIKLLRRDRMADREWAGKVLANDPAAVRELTLMNLIVANSFKKEAS